MMQCAFTPGDYTEIECVDACNKQNNLYEDWEDTEKQLAFDDHRQCIVASSCEKIEEGDCYDPLVFIFSDTP